MTKTVTVDSARLQIRAKRKRRRRNDILFFIFAAPNLLFISLFTYYPLIMNVYYSTLDWRLGAPEAASVGLRNYKMFFTSPNGLEVWRVTGIFTVVTVVASIAFGLLMALVLNRPLPGRTLTRTALFSPYVLSGVGVGMVWTFIFDPQLGVLRHFFLWLGKQSPAWFQDPKLTLAMVIFVYIWKNLGFCTVVLLSGLQTIPEEINEAASIDGVGSFRKFWSITLPLISPTLFFLVIVSILNSMQAFDILRIINPAGRGTNTIIFEIYLQGFGAYQRAGYAAAISVVLVVALFIITAIQMRFVERRVHYT